ncbi:hypothetical protein HMPREF7215_0653 [Pyramidobacter piscolens W5455]|uniref:Uncharacterized protein n=1 Tax=Pyramidobacter piscolens W5455 TaxID=352165 RepID=A0ABM9ZVY4_9BACT|nr:hypothetical protein HMPREF7215_0653 [Pyramidobacter piscolens W5455]
MLFHHLKYNQFTFPEKNFLFCTPPLRATVRPRNKPNGRQRGNAPDKTGSGANWHFSGTFRIMSTSCRVPI